MSQKNTLFSENLTPDDVQTRLQDLLAQTCRAGADAADVLFVRVASQSVSWCGGKAESLERAETSEIGLRVFIGKKQAIVSTTDPDPENLRVMIDRACAMAGAVPDDKYCGLADPSEIATPVPVLERADAGGIDIEALIAKARALEAGALAVPGVTRLETAEAGAGRSSVFQAATNGFAGHYDRTWYNLSLTALAGEGTGMEQDSDYAGRVFWEDLPDPAQVGRRAGERAVRRLGSRKVASCQVPVFFDPRQAHSLLGVFASAINGASVARGTSFLKDKRGTALFPAAVSIVDDPFLSRGLRSRAFDAEGLVPARRQLVADGVLTSWLMDLRAARQLGLASTGHAVRSVGGSPHAAATNLYIEAGTLSPDELMRDVKNGFYVTDLMGMGVNGVTGDFSQAASGFWIENGTLAYPVSEVTIAGNLLDMFKEMTAANDLVHAYGVDSPTLRIDRMTVAGT